jgi:hypothetical protein
VSVVDLYSTRLLLSAGFGAASAKMTATTIGFILNFAGRRLLVFPEKPNPDWKPQGATSESMSQQASAHSPETAAQR